MSLTQRTLWCLRQDYAPNFVNKERNRYAGETTVPRAALDLRNTGRMETKAHPAANSTADGLCYLSAQHVARPGGTLAGLELCNSEHESVGTVDGVLIDAPGRRVRYFVVKLEPSKHVLLPVDEVVHVDSEAGVPRLTTATGARLLRFDPRTVRPFSPEDAVTSMFAPSASHAA